jgi:hypothetical protein
MNVKHLVAVEKWTSILAALLILVGLAFLSRWATFSLAIGAGLMVLNAWVMRRVAQAVGKAMAPKPGLTLILFNFKLAILALLIFLVMHFLHVAPLPFIIGVSVLPAAILIVALQHQLTLPPDNGDGAPAPHDEEKNG